MQEELKKMEAFRKALRATETKLKKVSREDYEILMEDLMIEVVNEINLRIEDLKEEIKEQHQLQET